MLRLIIMDENDEPVSMHYIEANTLDDEDFINGLIDEVEAFEAGRS